MLRNLVIARSDSKLSALSYLSLYCLYSADTAVGLHSNIESMTSVQADGPEEMKEVRISL